MGIGSKPGLEGSLIGIHSGCPGSGSGDGIPGSGSGRGGMGSGNGSVVNIVMTSRILGGRSRTSIQLSCRVLRNARCNTRSIQPPCIGNRHGRTSCLLHRALSFGRPLACNLLHCGRALKCAKCFIWGKAIRLVPALSWRSPRGWSNASVGEFVSSRRPKTALLSPHAPCRGRALRINPLNPLWKSVEP